MLSRKQTFILIVALAGWASCCLRAAESSTNAAPVVKPAETNASAATQVASTNALSAAPGATNEIAAEGRGFKITRAELDKEVSRALRQMIADGRAIPPQQEEEIPRQILEQLINVRLILARATPADTAAGRERVAKRLAEAKAKAGSEEAFAQELKRMHITTNDLMAKWTDAVTADIVLKRELNINVTDQEVKKFYDDHPDQFQSPERVRIQHLLVDTVDRKTRTPLAPDQQEAKRKQAEALLKRAQGGEDFAKLVRENSDDPVSRDKGGEYIFTHGEMVSEIESAAFTMKTNEISEIIISRYGFHIIKLVEIFPPRRIPFNEAEADLKSGLIEDAIQQKFPAYIAELRKLADIKIPDPKLQRQNAIDPKSFLQPDKTIKPQ